MSTKIGHFEILSELAKSPTSIVYKANDLQNAQTVALKAIQLSAFGDAAAELQKCLLEETESTKALSSPNITLVHGAGEIDGQFCAAMEYIQGNSIATMLARKEGFSIWDLLDIGRQVGTGLDHAHTRNVFHYSLEPAKIMVGWDGCVKILGFGLSSAGRFTEHITEGLPTILHYTSPEQLRGEPVDARSNVFSLGAMFYEMVTDRKAFNGDDMESVRGSILESMPVPPAQVNLKIHPGLSDLIMKALSKNPEERYESGRALLDDLEKCKDSGTKTSTTVAQPAKAAAKVASGKVAASTPAPVAATPAPRAPEAKSPKKAEPQHAPAVSQAPKSAVNAPVKAVAKAETAKPKAAAAAAGWGGGETVSSTPDPHKLDASSQFITSCVRASLEAAEQPQTYMSAAVEDAPEIEAPEADAPGISVDPMMAERPAAEPLTSFSEINELPPLKEMYVPPPPPAAEVEEPRALPVTIFRPGQETEKPKIQPREVAQKAIKEIKNVPPSLMMYSIGGAVALILLIAGALTYYVHHQNPDDDSSASSSAASSVAPAPKQAAPNPAPLVQPTQPEVVVAPAARKSQAVATASLASAKNKNLKKKVPAPLPVVIAPGLMAVDSTPQGAQVQIDGKMDAGWVTPYTLGGLTPGQHNITVSKAGYTTDSRTVDVTSGSKSFVVIHLAALMAALAVTSSPDGASVFVDGKDTSKTTPSQLSLDKGSHVVLVRKAGYLDETTTAQFVPGQTVSFSPTLRALGNADGIKTVGKFKKMFGGNNAQAGMGTVSVKTQPKGAQIAVNQHMLDKPSPVDFTLDPGNYVIDITLSGYAPIHKVITVDKGGKAVLDETLERQP
jgi:serine/threonine protein kinase